jgi:hypothetical protein
MDTQDRKRIITSTTTTFIAQSTFIRQIIISVVDAGTTWKLRIQDKDTIPYVLVDDYTLSIASDGKPAMLDFTGQAGDLGVYMIKGIDIVTTGANPGIACVWISYQG